MTKTYKKSKQSGIEWIGEIPVEWQGIRLKNISSITKGKKAAEDFQDFGENLIPYLSMEYLRGQTESPIYVSNNDNSIVKVDENDLLILWDGSKAGEIVKAKRGALSSTMGKIHILNDKFNLNFLAYYLKNSETHLQNNTVGMGIPHVDGEILSDLFILQPSYNEQTQISRYLDHKIIVIDELINKKEKLVELLKEQRQSIIHETVTKGLNPNAKMIDSGIVSFGEIPEEWSLTRLKFISKVKGRIGYRGYTTDDLVEEGEGALALGATHITWDGDIDISNPVFINWVKYEESPEIKLEKGDIIIVQRGSTCGKVALISDEIGPATINPSLVVLKEINANPFYVFSSIKAALAELINLTSNTAIPMLSQEQIGNLKIVLPPLEEQNEIADFLYLTKTRFNDAIIQCLNSIIKLKEYRQSLISEAVTGKIDVRDWQPPVN